MTGLLVVSLVSGVLMLLLSFYPKYHNDNRLFYYLPGVAEICVFVFLLYTFKKKHISVFTENISFVVFFCSLLCFCMYAYMVDRSPFVVRFLVMFLSFQIIFVMGLITSIAVNTIIVLLFFTANKYSSGIWWGILTNSIFDVYNIILSALICMTLNWYTTRVIVSGIISYNHDQLTGLNNRRSFEQSVNFYTSVCRHVHQTVCVVMMDVDFFKPYNDFYGHTKGDIVLQSIGRALKKLSEEDGLYVARVGGEEFIILWTENRLLEAERVVLKLRQKIIDLQIPHEKSLVAPCITASFGLYFMRGGSLDSREELYNHADIALYKAKEAGRNCIMLLDSSNYVCRLVELRQADKLVRR
ncbi:MAG: GGDEF domain-containing protein [Spirochaetaceae bacterium]|jgi:diguanylate cyclase (GGDEF)-like protein|nr:GGDEF domain-containing protein [Spirochaetaceae bacterium]